MSQFTSVQSLIRLFCKWPESCLAWAIALAGLNYDRQVTFVEIACMCMYSGSACNHKFLRAELWHGIALSMVPIIALLI